jgi:hypothetical protein
MLVGAYSKGGPVRQPVPSHEGARHVQCICKGRDVGGVSACSKGEPVRQPVPYYSDHIFHCGYPKVHPYVHRK